MTSAALDFWNHPQWLNSSRDNPRDPNFEPFWMRSAAQAATYFNPENGELNTTHGIKLPYCIKMTGISQKAASSTQYIPNYDCIIRFYRNGVVIEEIFASRGDVVISPSAVDRIETETDADHRFFVLKESTPTQR